MAFPSYGNLSGNINKVKIIALTSAQRSARVPNVPTVAETIPGFRRIPGWIAMFGPAGMQAFVVNRLNTELNAALKSKEVTEALDQQITMSLASSPTELGAIVRADLEQGQKLANAVGLKPE